MIDKASTTKRKWISLQKFPTITHLNLNNIITCSLWYHKAFLFFSFFRLVSYARTWWVLNPCPHLPTYSFTKGGNAIWDRAHWHKINFTLGIHKALCSFYDMFVMCVWERESEHVNCVYDMSILGELGFYTRQVPKYGNKILHPFTFMAELTN